MYSSSYFNIFAMNFITLVRISHAGKIISKALVKVLIFIKSSLIFLMEILFVGTSKAQTNGKWFTLSMIFRCRI